jgi:hypothetical protein
MSQRQENAKGAVKTSKGAEKTSEGLSGASMDAATCGKGIIFLKYDFVMDNGMGRKENGKGKRTAFGLAKIMLSGASMDAATCGNGIIFFKYDFVMDTPYFSSTGQFCRCLTL